MSGILNAFVGGSYGALPVNTVAPVVSGTATFGQTLSTTNGTWTGVPAPTYTYQWQRGGSNIGSATASTYTLVAGDVGFTIRCVVTATNAIGSASANSNSTSAVIALVPSAPTIGTATATGSTTATVTYTASASNGGGTITSYTATSSPGGITGSLATSGSGTINVSGLSGSTSYTFTVYATNSAGNSPSSASSNSITTLPAIGSAYGGGYFAGQISTSGNGIANYNLVVSPKSSGQTFAKFSVNNSGGDPTSLVDGPGNSTTMNNSSHPAAQFCKAVSAGGYSDWYMPAKNELEILYYNLKPVSSSNNTTTGSNPNSIPPRSNYTASVPGLTSAAIFQDGESEAFTMYGSSGNSLYWSSTQYNEDSDPPYYGTYAWSQYLNVQTANQGKQRGYQKIQQKFTRAIRRVAV